MPLLLERISQLHPAQQDSILQMVIPSLVHVVIQTDKDAVSAMFPFAKSLPDATVFLSFCRDVLLLQVQYFSPFMSKC